MSPLRTEVLLVLLLPACGIEQYYGPYPLAAPTEIGERSAAHTFELPLDPGAQAEQAALTACENETPDRDPPCRCDHPVLRAGSFALRLDYGLKNQGPVASAGVWLALETPSGAAPLSDIPDRPTLELMLQHTFRLKPGEEITGSFSEDDFVEAERLYALSRYSSCEATAPAPLQWVAGVSLLEGAGPLAGEAVFRVRTGGM